MKSAFDTVFHFYKKNKGYTDNHSVYPFLLFEYLLIQNYEAE